MMNKETFLYITLIILLAPFFLVSLGLENDMPAMWWIGLILLGIGGIIPPTTRFAFKDSEDKEEQENSDKQNKED